MTAEIRIWQVLGEQLRECPRGRLDIESRLERWLDHDIGILDEDLRIIGRQVETDFGGIIDLLCMNPDGDLVVVELKRDRTPREVTAQVLDYASWVDGLSGEAVNAIATSLGSTPWTPAPSTAASPVTFGALANWTGSPAR